ncbi:MAG: AAA family ATPase [Dehalococcoidia bacterium]
MIPIRVTMSGWMRYRDQTTADFAGARLLSICGENGSGKSSIFDAITFALFGHHRQGTQHIDELISDGGDQCAVELEFEQEGKRYRVRRTRGRRAAQGSQGLWIWDAIAEDWATVPNTQYVRGLNAALAAVIRITPTAFTSSFLLQQGAATDFLDATPANRFSVVSSLVNLEEYQTLEKKAREAHRSDAAEVQRLSTKLQEFDGVDADSLEILRARLDQAMEQRSAAERDRDSARGLREKSRDYARVKVQIDHAHRQIESARELLSEATSIEQNARRFASLAGEIDAVRQIQSDLETAGEAALQAADAQRLLSTIDVETFKAASQTASSRLTAAGSAVERFTKEHHAAVARERTAAEFLQLAGQITSLRTRLASAEIERGTAQLELARLPGLELESARLRAVESALPYLQNLGNARKEVERFGKGDPRVALAALEMELERLTADLEDASQGVQATAVLLVEAQETAARVHAEAASLRDQITRRNDGIDEAICSRCGQPVNPEQARRELEALVEQATAVEHRAVASDKTMAQAAIASADAVRRRDHVQEALRQADADRRGLLLRIEDLERAVVAAADAYRQFVDVAPESLRDAISESLPLPQLHEVYRAHKAMVGKRTEVEVSLRHLHSLQGELRKAEQQIIQIRNDLANAEDSAGAHLDTVESAATLHQTAEEILRRAQTALETAQVDERAARQSEADARDAFAVAQEERHRLETSIVTRTKTAESHRRTAQRLAVRVDPALQDRVMNDPRAVLDLLERERDRLEGAEERLSQLLEARRLHSHFGGVLATLTDELQRIPEHQRIDEPAAQAALDRAEAVLQETNLACENWQREVSRMERDLEQAEVMRADLARSETRSQRLRRLVDFLGKTGLQGALVSEALETVMSNANAFLERLTGGTLVLRLERGDGDALELKAQDVTCMRDARSVQVLSGSQKFRCAVAIAAGIGQYAGAGGMRSIVIDEGFGSLDQQGQHLIIEELKNLAEHMDRVIVVSHLDAFSDRVHFPDQIRVIREGDRSRIERAS